MKTPLMCFSIVVLTALIGVSVWATSHMAIGPAISMLWAEPTGGTNPWFYATLFDAYFGFLWFYLWIAYRERSMMARLIWLVLILLGGNIAMAIYMLIQLATLPAGSSVEQLLRRKS